MKSLTILISEVAYNVLLKESQIRGDSPEQLASNAIEDVCMRPAYEAAIRRNEAGPGRELEEPEERIEYDVRTLTLADIKPLPGEKP